MRHFPLHTTRLILREFIESDLPKFTTYRNQPDVAHYQSWSSFSRENAEAFFREQKQLIFDTDDTWF